MKIAKDYPDYVIEILEKTNDFLKIQVSLNKYKVKRSVRWLSKGATNKESILRFEVRLAVNTITRLKITKR